MNYISITNLKSLSFVKIVIDSSDKFCVLIGGLDMDGAEAAGFIETWDILDHAMICAKGVAKMFNINASLIGLESSASQLRDRVS